MTERVEQDLVGSTLVERFRLDRVLGEGAMGKVYAGTQLSVDRKVAVKVLHSHMADDEVGAKRFFREAEVISNFSHPGIVELVEFGEDEQLGVYFLAMEFLRGAELRDLTAGRRVAPAMAVEIARQTCDALSEPHADEVVHRDLKPENLMVVRRSDGGLQVKIVDFGIAHVIEQTTQLTQFGAVLGTPHYIAPEQAKGQSVGPGADLYAVGCILFELIAGKTPFVADTPVELMMAHIREEPPALVEEVSGNAEIDELSELIDSLLGKSPGERPESALQVCERLDDIARRFQLPSVRLTADVPYREAFEPWLVSEDTEMSKTETIADAPPEMEDHLPEAEQPTDEDTSTETLALQTVGGGDEIELDDSDWDGTLELATRPLQAIRGPKPGTDVPGEQPVPSIESQPGDELLTEKADSIDPKHLIMAVGAGILAFAAATVLLGGFGSDDADDGESERIEPAPAEFQHRPVEQRSALDPDSEESAKDDEESDESGRESEDHESKSHR